MLVKYYPSFFILIMTSRTNESLQTACRKSSLCFHHWLGRWHGWYFQVRQCCFLIPAAPRGHRVMSLEMSEQSRLQVCHKQSNRLCFHLSLTHLSEPSRCCSLTLIRLLFHPDCHSNVLFFPKLPWDLLSPGSRLFHLKWPLIPCSFHLILIPFILFVHGIFCLLFLGDT